MGPNSTTKLLSLQLHISNVSAQDVGWYTCGTDFKIDDVTANVFLSLKEETLGGKIDDQGNRSFRSSFCSLTDIIQGRHHEF